MRQCLIPATLVGILFVSCGCSGKQPVMLKAKGKVVKGGSPFIPDDEDVGLQLAFVPISADGTPPRNWYVAEVNQKTGEFTTTGGHNLGMPPGKYRVAVELKKDRKDTLSGKFDALHSPFEFEVSEKPEEMVIDLDEKPLPDKPKPVLVD